MAHPDQIIQMNDITFFRGALAKYGRQGYEAIRDKHYRALKMLAQGRNYALAKVPDSELDLFVKHCIFMGRMDRDYVLLLNNDYVCRRDLSGQIIYPT